VGEAATNAIEHAGSGGGSPFEVAGRLRAAAWTSSCATKVLGESRATATRGAGLSLMRALMDDVDVDPSAEGTSVRLRRRLNGAEPGA